MAILTKKEIQKIEEYYYWKGYKSWAPFPLELKEKLLSADGEKPLPHYWTEQAIDKGSRKLIFDYFNNTSR
ncbi:hypothetical protein BAZO_20078 [Schinkia azotoformans LMG 9581]|uniref:Uncharacterized protein n=1 Tax=Schinkia azotoformans LMG 9581 TaxID=1131731 RepID=K6DPN4_SCHAZ|nr:hypothetical protein BAZO_20078 [Schinkia azotoformans LMG 9581]